MTVLFIFLIFLFLIMTAFPFVLACFIPKESEPATLIVHSQNKKDPRYFANSFENIMENALQTYKTTQQTQPASQSGQHSLNLSHTETFVFAKELSNAYDIVEQIVISEEDFTSKPETTFKKELYIKGDAIIATGTSLRAIKAASLILRDHSQIIRWADGTNSTYVGRFCKLGVSCSSANKLTLEGDCQFQKLYAPHIIIGHCPIETKNGTDTISPDEVVEAELLRNIKEVEDATTLSKTIITKHTITIGASSIIQGHIKSQKQIILGPGTTVYGNVIAEKEILIHEGCRIYGDVFSQTHIILDQKCVIGQSGKIKSMVARETISISEGCIVYGFIGCENQGHILTSDAIKQELSKYNRR